jgi:hypothetical protein
MQLHSEAAFKQLIMRGSVTIYNLVIMSFNRVCCERPRIGICLINDARLKLPLLKDIMKLSHISSL